MHDAVSDFCEWHGVKNTLRYIHLVDISSEYIGALRHTFRESNHLKHIKKEKPSCTLSGGKVEPRKATDVYTSNDHPTLKSQREMKPPKSKQKKGRPSHEAGDSTTKEGKTIRRGPIPEHSNFSDDAKQTPKTNKKLDNCPICLATPCMPRKLEVCRHHFCEECIERAFQVKKTCPVCGVIYGNITGTQPMNGKMRHITEPDLHLPGYENYGVIVIDYHFSSGIQTVSEHFVNPKICIP